MTFSLSIETTIYVGVLLGLTFLISYIMEIFKKVKQKKTYSKYINYLAGFVLSALATFILNLIQVFKPILGIIGAPLWADYILYTLLFYFAQFEVSMRLIKAITQRFIKNFLKDKGFTDEEIKKLFNSTT